MLDEYMKKSDLIKIAREYGDNSVVSQVCGWLIDEIR